MANINEYIVKSKNAKVINKDGNSVYDFGEYVLVDYSSYNNAGIANVDAEKISKAINIKNKLGVRVPRHLAFKRVSNKVVNHCYILEDKIYGNKLSEYSAINNSLSSHIYKLEELVNSKDEYFSKYVKDIRELYNMDIDFNPNNIVFNSNKTNGGFSFLRCNSYDRREINYESFIEMLSLDDYARHLINITSVNDNEIGSKEDKDNAIKLHNKLKAKLFNSYKTSFPHFDFYKRWLLRSYSKEDQLALNHNGIEVGDLTLTKEEERVFFIEIKLIIKECIDKIKSGKSDYQDIIENQIPKYINKSKLDVFWKYHKSNPIRTQVFKSNEDREIENTQFIIDEVILHFNSLLEKEAKSEINSKLDVAYKESKKEIKLNR